MKAQADTQERLYIAETDFLNLESRAPVEIARRLTENMVLLKSMELREAEVALVEEVEREKYKIELESQHNRLQSRFKEAEELAILGKRDKTLLVELFKEVKASIDAIDLETLDSDILEKRFADVEAKAKAERDKAAKARSAQARARKNKRLADQKMENAQRILLERQAQNELFSLRSLQLQHMKQVGVDELELLKSKHQLQLDKAGKNNTQRLMADIRFEMAKTDLVKSQEAEREKARLDAFEKSQATLAKLRDSVQDQINQAGEFASAFGGAFAEASYGALAMGESFTDSISKIIHGLGQQAAVEALIESAKVFASLAIGDFTGAAAHGKAAAGFATGAIAAGVAGNAIGGSGGGSGGGDVSPSGASQIAPSQQRERAEESQTVFNINFGGAVIYDTKQAAERALVDRIVDVMNQQNRGSRRLNLGRS